MLVGGQIIDETGLPLPGVNIYSNDMVGVGTISDANGNWQLSIADKTMLNFSFMGFKTVKVCSCEVPGVIQMKIDTSMLNNVTVTAPKKAGMSFVGKLLLGGLIFGMIAKAVPGIIADNKSYKKYNDKGLKGFKKVSL